MRFYWNGIRYSVFVLKDLGGPSAVLVENSALVVGRGSKKYDLEYARLFVRLARPKKM